MDKLMVSSRAFKQGGAIPDRFTCSGENISPEISWQAAPKSTRSFAVICDDPDAPSGTWVHWVIYDIPPGINILHEDFPKNREFKDGTKQGMNDFKRTGYGGPCPPSGTHRYFFRVYALDSLLGLDPSSAGKGSVLEAMKNHTIGYGEMFGTYKK